MAAIAVASIALIGGIGALAIVQPWHRAETAWHSFKYAGEPTGAASHFGGLGSNRYDFWRVALIEFKHHPVQGIGPNNFQVPYLQLRRSGEEPIYPHSLALGLLSQTGLIGTGALRRLPRADRARRAANPSRPRTRACRRARRGRLGVAPAWAGRLALGDAGPERARHGPARCGLRARSEARPGGATAGWAWRLGIAGGAAAATVVAAAAIVFPWFAERDAQQAIATWPSDSAAAFSLLQRAHA